MAHTFLFEEGEWEASGLLFDEEGSASIASGGVRICHRVDCWEMESWLESLENRYTMAPFSPQEVTQQWEAINPAVGIMKGSFVVVGDVILSRYASEDGLIKGVESFRQIEPQGYECRGAALMEGRAVHRWELAFKKKQTTSAGACVVVGDLVTP